MIDDTAFELMAIEFKFLLLLLICTIVSDLLKSQLRALSALKYIFGMFF